MTSVDQAIQWRGMDVVDRDGEKIGKIDEIYLDQETDRPEWAVVSGGGLFGGGSTFVPIAGAQEQGGQIQVPFEKSHVKDAPGVDAGGELSQEEEQRLYSHYGMDYGESRSETGLPESQSGMATGDPTPEGSRGVVGEDVSGPETDQAMTRSEEELQVGTSQRETGRARLRKYVVADEVQETVPVQREELRVEREPITEANIDQATSGPELSEEEHEVTLMEEEVVAEKRVVPKERVRVDKDTVTEEAQVSEEVRKEQIDLDEGAGDRDVR